MKLQFDLSKTYAIALEGGGAKGAYQIGVWKALDEAGLRYNAVSGSSVGALNGYFMATHGLDKAREIWENIRFSQVMNVDDKLLASVFDREEHESLKDRLGNLWELGRYMMDAVRDGGIDIAPLRELLKETVDEEALRASDVDLYVVTYSLDQHEELDIDVKTLPQGQVPDILMASAYLPGFKRELLAGGKRFADGGVQDLIPIHSLTSRGYQDILVLRIYGIGLQRHFEIPEDVNITTIAPREKLGNMLNFDAESARRNIQLGYYDGLRFLYGLRGGTYYIDPTMTEDEAYEVLLSRREPEESRRHFNEVHLPALAKKLGCRDGDYLALLLACLEAEAAVQKLEVFQVYTDRELLHLLSDAVSSAGK